MRRLVLLCFAAGLLASTAAAPAPAAAAVKIDPVRGQVPAQPVWRDTTAMIPLSGRAAPGQLVELRARCPLVPCTARTITDRKGRWRTTLHVALPPGRKVVFVRPSTGGKAQQVKLRLPRPDAVGGRPELVLIGDSLAVGTAPYLPGMLPGWRVTVDALSGRFLYQGMTLLDQLRKPLDRPVALAFSLFTNDDPRQAPQLAEQARISVEGLPKGSCSIWATIVRPKFDGVAPAIANAALDRLAAVDPRIKVVQWARAVKTHPRWLRDDGIHYTPEGYVARAQMYADAARSCAGLS